MFPKKKTLNRNSRKKVLAGATQPFLLPIDLHIKPLRLTHLFQRGVDAKKNAKNQKNILEDHDDIELEYHNLESQPEFGATIEQFTTYDNPFNEEDEQPNLDSIFGKELEEQRQNEHINVKILKGKIWHYLSGRVEDIDPEKEDSKIIEEALNLKSRNSIANFIQNKSSSKRNNEKAASFSNVCKSLPKIINDVKEKASIHSCFVTILHLANEKTLRFVKIDDENDFRIFREGKKSKELKELKDTDFF